ncbi:MAG TPA: RidA family protein [Rhabdochlamydiaceae bacterium]|nr:RidA family protein [Rhabdochlamydiaceae bacterium]
MYATDGIQAINPVDGPKAIGPYSPGVIADLSKGKLLFVSGQLPLDAQTGMKIDGDIKEATRVTFENIARILKDAGCTFEQVVRMDVFLRDLKDFPGMNEVYATYFSNGKYPARQTIECHIPAIVEISCIALVP